MNDAGLPSFIQGDVAVAVCHEAGGNICEQALNLPSELSSFPSASPAERAAFTTHALQCLHATNLKGVAKLIRSRTPIKNGPCLPQRNETIDLGALPNCPTRYATVLQAPATNLAPNAILNYTYFKDDSTLKKKDTILKYDVQPNGLEYKFTITTNILDAKKNGFYNLTKITDNNGEYVPEVKFGFIAYSNELRRRVQLAETLKNLIVIDSIKKPITPTDSIKNVFQKIETPFKSRLEAGVLTGGSIFLGTISKKGSLSGNNKNMLLGLHVNYILYSNISVGLSIESFKLSNADTKSNNNEQLARGMSFSTSMLSISPSINYDFVDNRLYSKAKKIKPSIGLGLDIVSFNPTGIYNGTKYNLQPLGTGGQYSDSTKKPYSKLTLGYFLNFKVKYQIDRFNSVGLHMSYHVSMSKYLDDVGPDAYPSITSLLKSNITNKDAAIYFSNPTSRNVVGQYRNSPDGANDSYFNFGIYYSRKLFK